MFRTFVIGLVIRANIEKPKASGMERRQLCWHRGPPLPGEWRRSNGHAVHRRLEPIALGWVSVNPVCLTGGDARHQALLAMVRRKPEATLAEL